MREEGAEVLEGEVLVEEAAGHVRVGGEMGGGRKGGEVQRKGVGVGGLIVSVDV